MLKADSGDILFNDESIYKSKETLRNCRFNVGLCFQYPEQQLFESTVYRDIAFGPTNMGLSEDEIKERVYESIAFVNLSEDYLEKSPFDLSGGEKRRVAIAGVLAMKPKVLILDEPTAGLDPVGKQRLLDLITEYNKSTGSAVIFVSHNMDDVSSIAHRVIVMNDGLIHLDGTVEDVFSQGERLASLGLDVPEVTSVFLELKKAGFDLGKDEYTVEGATKAIKALLEKGGNL